MTTTVLAPRAPGSEGASSFAAQQLRRGLEYYAAGEIAEAVAAYQSGLLRIASEPQGDASVETITSLHANLGSACMVRGDLEAAARNYEAALELAPHLTACWCNLGTVLLKSGNVEDAIALYLKSLSLDPGHWPSRTNLVQALMGSRQFLMAKALLLELLSERPRDGQLHNQLGKLHFQLGDMPSAVGCFEQAVALNPSDSDSIYWIGSVRQQLGEAGAAEAAYAEAAIIQPLIRRPAAKFPAEFRVLALFAPLAGNTPADYLFKDAAYDTDTLTIVSSGRYDSGSLRRDLQVVVNLISDADQAGDVLPLAVDLVDRLGKPTVNDPRQIGNTTRDAIAVLLRGIAACRVPRILRQRAGTVLSMTTVLASLPVQPCVLARPAGTHGGDDFEKIGDPAELAAFLAERPDSDHYLIEYIDYRSADGYFRKYRFIFVGDQILPYHLAISSDWKVHHDSTDMDGHDWMQREEEAFLTDPASVFDAGHYRVLDDIKQRIGLEFFGIDCALDQSGVLVVFEVNASMLVHDGNEKFPYKAPAVARIKVAFDEMLRKLATAGAAAPGPG